MSYTQMLLGILIMEWQELRNSGSVPDCIVLVLRLQFGLSLGRLSSKSKIVGATDLTTILKSEQSAVD